MLRFTQQKLVREMQQNLQAPNSRLATAAAGLNAVSPLATLERGYSIINAAESGKLVRDAAELEVGDQIRARLAAGEIEASVTKTKS